MRWTLYIAREAVQKIYQIPIEIWREAKPMILALQDEPLPDNAQPDEDNPSALWLPLPGDYVVTYEIIDEKHLIKIIDVE